MMSLRIGFRRSADSQDSWQCVKLTEDIVAFDTSNESDMKPITQTADLSTIALTPDSSPIKDEKQNNTASALNDHVQDLQVSGDMSPGDVNSPYRKRSMLQYLTDDSKVSPQKSLQLKNGKRIKFGRSKQRMVSITDDAVCTITAVEGPGSACTRGQITAKSRKNTRKTRATTQFKDNSSNTDISLKCSSNTSQLNAAEVLSEDCKLTQNSEITVKQPHYRSAFKLMRSSPQKVISTPRKPTPKTTPKRKARSRKVTDVCRKNTSGSDSSTKENVETAKDGKVKVEKDKITTLVTDYFSVRRSGRMTSTEMKKMQQTELQDKILNDCEEGLEIVEFPVKGRGIVSTRPFMRGDFVVEYKGDLLSTAAAKKREKTYSNDSKIGCYMYYFNYNNKSYCLDATKPTVYFGRLLNHSRRGNCKTRVVGIKNRPYLILEAARDIEKGEELLYDYGDRSPESLQSYPWLAL